jgi:hypothetical protein
VEKRAYLCGCLVRFRIEREHALCRSLNRDVGSFVGLNFRNKSYVSLVLFHLLFISLVLARVCFTFEVYLYTIVVVACLYHTLA